MRQQEQKFFHCPRTEHKHSSSYILSFTSQVPSDLHNGTKLFKNDRFEANRIHKSKKFPKFGHFFALKIQGFTIVLLDLPEAYDRIIQKTLF